MAASFWPLMHTGLNPYGSIFAMMHQDIPLCFICVPLDWIVSSEILVELKLW